LKSVTLSDNIVHSRNQNQTPALLFADELQKKAALQTMEPVVISTNQVTGKLMRSKSSAFTDGFRASHDEGIGVS